MPPASIHHSIKLETSVSSSRGRDSGFPSATEGDPSTAPLDDDVPNGRPHRGGVSLKVIVPSGMPLLSLLSPVSISICGQTHFSSEFLKSLHV